jgi:hypothetical protein
MIREDQKELDSVQGEQEDTPVGPPKISREEKLFWGTIVLLFFVTIVVIGLGYYRHSDYLSKTDSKQSIIEKKLLEELKKNAAGIDKSLREKQKAIEHDIDKKVDQLFEPVYANIESFLDFHYSVLGEYQELAAMALTDTFAQLIEDRLTGEQFSVAQNSLFASIEQELNTLKQDHQQEMISLVTENFEEDIKSDIVNKLTKDSFYRLGATAATVLPLKTAAKSISSKLAVKLAGKLTSKLGTKAAVKTTVKTASKSAAAGTAGIAGLSCGPFAVVCSPALALGAWFLADAAVTTVDEVLTRDDFREELIKYLNDMKRKTKQYLTNYARKDLAVYSEKLRSRMETITVPVRVKEIIK